MPAKPTKKSVKTKPKAQRPARRKSAENGKPASRDEKPDASEAALETPSSSAPDSEAQAKIEEKPAAAADTGSENWKFHEGLYAALPAELTQIALNRQEHPTRERLTAARLLATLHGQNRAEAHKSDDDAAGMLADGGLSLADVTKLMLHDRDYLEYLRKSAILSDSGAVGADGESRQLEDGAAPGPD